MKRFRNIGGSVVALSGLAAWIWVCVNTVASCTNEPPKTEQQVIKEYQSYANDTYRVITFDGCEYLVYQYSQPDDYGYVYSVTHKGNCKNPIHQVEEH